MKTAQEWLDLYSESHHHPINKLIHWACIPLIMLSTLGLLWSIPWRLGHPWLNLATLAAGAALTYYGAISSRLAAGMGVVTAVMLGLVAGLASLAVPLWLISVMIFAAAWVAQFVGHKIEGKKPSFFEDLQFLLIGPLWLLSDVYRRIGLQY